MQTKHRPLRSAQHYQGDSTASEVLLIPHALVGGEEHVKTRAFRLSQQIAVGERVPSQVFRPGDAVAGKQARNAARRYTVKENEHPQENLRDRQAQDQDCGRQIPVPH